MQVEPLEVLGWGRWLSLIACFAGAAYLDHKYRRIPNDYWMSWAKPAIFIWALELLVIEADWIIWGTAAAAVAFASTALIGRPTIKDILDGNPLDIVVSLWYVFGFAGVLAGAMTYGSTSTPLDLMAGTAEPAAKMWWSALSVLLQVWIFDAMWKVRLLHGGADAKALMWVAILLPTWATIAPIEQGDSWTRLAVHIPPSFALLIWGSLAFLLIPFIMTIYNASKGHITSLADMRLAWHATRMPLSEVMDSHVWLLDHVIDKADGTRGIQTRIRAPTRTPTDEKLAAQIAELVEAGSDTGWVTHKWPLLLALLPAILPMIIWGDPFGFLLAPLIG